MRNTLWKSYWSAVKKRLKVSRWESMFEWGLSWGKIVVDGRQLQSGGSTTLMKVDGDRCLQCYRLLPLSSAMGTHSFLLEKVGSETFLSSIVDLLSSRVPAHLTDKRFQVSLFQWDDLLLRLFCLSVDVKSFMQSCPHCLFFAAPQQLRNCCTRWGSD